MNCTNDKLEQIKCQNGLCYSSLSILNTTATCGMNENLLVKLGTWKPVFPSQDFWT
jgi:hypothetical protein